MARARALIAPLYVLALACVFALGPVPAAGAQEERSNLALLRDFIHFTRIANYDVAEALGAELVGREMAPVEFTELVEGSGELARFEQTVAQAARIPQLESIAAAMDRLFRRGKLERARDPDEIARNIALLSEGLRARTLARERLIAAGEYAMPQLLKAFLQRGNPALRAQAQRVMIDLGRQAILPLVTALDGLDPSRQEGIVEVLGQIPYRTSLPFLTELHASTGSDRVRTVAERAIRKLDARPGADVAGLFYALADGYYFERAELTSFPDEEFQLLWNFDPGVGLVMVPIRTEVYHEAMAMRMAERSLRADGDRPETIALWIAANFSREIDTPAGYDNPAYPPERREAEYFAVAAGTDIAQRVLRRGLDNRDTPLARRAIAAIERTAGAGVMVGAEQAGEPRPILSALNYQNKRVQYEAALAIGRAQPRSTFSGSERVVPLLASAVRDAAERYAVVLAGREREDYERIRELLELEGYTVLPHAPGGLDDIRGPIAESPGIDLMVTILPFEASRLAVEQARSDTRLAVTPVLILTDADRLEELRLQFRRDRTVAVRRAAIPDDAVVATIDDLLETAVGGPIDFEEAEIYADRALAVLRDLAVSRNPVLDAADAATPLISVLGDRTGRRMLDVAEVLAHVEMSRAQVALMDRAFRASGAERIALMEKVADSAKRYGSRLADRHIRRLVELAADPDDDVATAAVAVLGALELPYADLLPLILQEREHTRTTSGRYVGP